jgi:hypothetical protein
MAATAADTEDGLDPGLVDGILTQGGLIDLGNGTTIIPVPAGVMSLDQCGSGGFCTWISPNYTGTVTRKTGNPATYSIGGTVGSFWNNRSTVALLYASAGSSGTCYAAGARKATATTIASIYLSTATSC